jgi:endonuclease YncB( thermonuclease family)
LLDPIWAREFTATVIRVTDGDTLVVRTAEFEDVKIRLFGIDAPESRQERAGLRPRRR